MAQHTYRARTPHADGESLTERLERLSTTRSWDVRDDSSGEGGIRFDACAPSEVYAQVTAPATEDPAPAFLTRQRQRRPRWRGAVSLMWAGLLALGAMQHAGEVERRANASEPSASELAMQERPTQQIRAAWRELQNATAPSAGAEAGGKTEQPIVAMARTETQRSGTEDGLSDMGPHAIAAADSAQPKKADAEPADLDRSEQVAVVTDAVVPEQKDALGETTDPQKQALLETAATAKTDTPRTIEADAIAAIPNETDELPATLEGELDQTAAQEAEPTEIEPRWQQRRRSRASRTVVAAVFITPGEFVASRYFSVYGLNGRAP